LGNGHDVSPLHDESDQREDIYDKESSGQDEIEHLAPQAERNEHREEEKKRDNSDHGRTLHEGGRGRIGIDEFSQGWFLLHTVIVQ